MPLGYFGFFDSLALAQTHACAAAVLVDEFDAGRLQGALQCIASFVRRLQGRVRVSTRFTVGSDSPALSASLALRPSKQSPASPKLLIPMDKMFLILFGSFVMILSDMREPLQSMKILMTCLGCDR